MNRKGIIILIVAVLIVLALGVVIIFNNRDASVNEIDSNTELIVEDENMSDEEVREKYWIERIDEMEESILHSDKIETVDVMPKSSSEYESNGKIIYVELTVVKDALVDEEFEKGIRDYIINLIQCKEVVINIVE